MSDDPDGGSDPETVDTDGGSDPETVDTDGGSDPEADDPGAVDPETVRHVAGLARVDLEEADVERFAEQFADILAYFETLDEVPEVEREPDLTNVMRADEVRDGLSREEALANAPETEEGYFKGPKVS